MTDSVGGVTFHLSDMPNKADYPSRLLQEVTYLGMHACIIFLYVTLTGQCNFLLASVLHS